MIVCAFDDTDSVQGGCTTHIAAQLTKLLLGKGVNFIDYPNLIRLNPNIPFKTRGNGAVCLRFISKNITESNILDLAQDIIESFYEKNMENTNPGLAVYSQPITKELREFSQRALTEVCSIEKANQIADNNQVQKITWGNGRGLVGALGAIGNSLDSDHTFELLAFRMNQNWKTPRQVNRDSVIRMNQKTYPLTFNNIDEETNHVLITPKGPDPVLYGIRGETPQIVYEAHKHIEVEEQIDSWLIFRTNQGTDAHFIYKKQISALQPYCTAKLQGSIVAAPQTTLGGHVFFELKDSSGIIPCAAYEPSGNLRKIVRGLIKGDKVQVYGGTKPPSIEHPMTLNLEKFEIIELATHIEYKNPICPDCKKRMKSAGTGKGFKCKCGRRLRNTNKISNIKARFITEGIYYPPARSMRHLVKPHQRIGYEKFKKPDKLIEPWNHFKATR